MEYAVVTKTVSTIYECPLDTMEAKGEVISAVSDEALSGMLLVITGKETEGYLPIRTFYGYTGYISSKDVRLFGREASEAWEDSALCVTDAFCVDVVSLPKVQGVRLASLFRGSIVQVLLWESEEAGWAKIRLADDRTGYIRNQYLREKRFSQKGIFGGEIIQSKILDEQQFRKDVVETAKTFLGVQYRWGGRSTAGIDCSGLTSVSYMLNGILTYRDARIEKGYPVHEIPLENRKQGDLLYFPGHIAMYVGENRYIHSTGKVGSGGVVYNSLDAGSREYRQDLAESLYAVGSIF